MSFHIAYVIQQFPPEVGAGPARATEMARQWLARGARVSIITAFPTRRIPGALSPAAHDDYRRRFSTLETWESLNVLRSWVYPAREGGAARTIANNLSFMVTSFANGLHRLTKPNVIIASSPPFFAKVAGYSLARALNVPIVLELRDLWPDYLVGLGQLRKHSFAARALFWLEARMLNGADHVVTVTDGFARRVREKGVKPERITTIPNGVNTELYFPAPDSTENRDEFTVGYLGTFGVGQALESVVESAAILNQRSLKVRFRLVGDGPRRRRIMDLVSAAGLENIVLEPPIEKTATPAFYRECDVCLVPHAPVSEFADTIPSKLFEIMACAKPVVASVIGETKRIVEESQCGLVAAPGNAQQIASAIEQLRQMSAQQRQEMGMRGNRYVTERFNRVAAANRYYDLLEQVAR